VRRIFGKEYEMYEKSVNEIFPFPIISFRGKVSIFCPTHLNPVKNMAGKFLDYLFTRIYG
jgi:hypothetical protein